MLFLEFTGEIFCTCNQIEQNFLRIENNSVSADSTNLAQCLYFSICLYNPALSQMYFLTNLVLSKFSIIKVNNLFQIHMACIWSAGPFINLLQTYKMLTLKCSTSNKSKTLNLYYIRKRYSLGNWVH